VATNDNFEPYAPEVIVAGPREWGKFGRATPLYHYQGRFDFFISSDYSDIKDNVLQDNATWLYSKGTSPKMLDERMACGMMTDPPIHNSIRIIVQRGFTPRRLARMEVCQVFEKLVARLPSLRLTGQPQRAPGFNFWGQDNVPVAWD